MTKKEANEELVKILNDLVQHNPDLRFNQILVVFNFVTKDSTIDFYIEPKDVLERVKERLFNGNI